MTSVDLPAPEVRRPAETSARWRAVLLAAVAACAASGIIYELALLTLAASLNGGGIVATSLIVAGYIAALGVGALVVKPLLAHAAMAFIVVEVLLSIVGGLSAAALYTVFAFIDDESMWMLAVAMPRSSHRATISWTCRCFRWRGSASLNGVSVRNSLKKLNRK